MAYPSELLVLAGGFGTRLRSAVGDVPKPLAPVAGQPFLHYLIESWMAQGIESMTFLLHHGAQDVVEYLDRCKQEGRLQRCRVRALTEPEPLGTGGAVAHAVRTFGLTETFLVANADTWLGTGIAKVSAVGAPAMAVLTVADTARYGSVLVEEGRVLTFAEKQDSRGAGYINAGLYHLPAAAFAAWTGAPCSLERDVFPRMVEAGELRATSLETDFIDIGIPKDYFRFCRWVESGKEAAL